MTKIFKKKAIVNIIAVIMLFTCLFTASAIGVERSWSSTLPWLRNGVDLLSGTSETGDRNGEAALTSMGGTFDAMWVLFRANNGGWTNVTNSAIIYEGQGYKTLALQSTIAQGTQMMLHGGNDDAVPYNVSAAGTVKFP